MNLYLEKPNTIRNARLLCFSNTLFVMLENNTIPIRNATTTVPTVNTFKNQEGLNQLFGSILLVAVCKRGSYTLNIISTIETLIPGIMLIIPDTQPQMGRYIRIAVLAVLDVSTATT